MQTSSNTTCDVIDIDVQANLEMYLIEPILKPQLVSHRHQSGKWQRRGGVGGQWKMGGGQMGKVRSGPEGQLIGCGVSWVGGWWQFGVGVRWVGGESGG